MNGENISKLTLGTVQLGSNYGIANKIGQPNVISSHELLSYALQNGISSLDTARQYGTAEEVIGSFLKKEHFYITTKFKLSNDALNNVDLAIIEAEKSAKDSCKMLGINKLSLLLLHKNPDQNINLVSKILPQVFQYLKIKGLISEGGISVFAPDEINHINDYDNITAIQAPLNILDTRLIRCSSFQTLLDKNVKIFIRSVYLQGLILMQDSEMPEHLKIAKPYINQLQRIAKDTGLSLKHLALNFVKDISGITSIVVGAETISQLKENIDLLNLPSLSKEVTNKIISAFENIPEEIITPAFWPKLKA